MKNHTWELVDLPPGRSVVSCKWLLKCKYHSDGTIARCKACLVAHGFSQIAGIDYTETFSPVVQMQSLVVMIALAAIHNLHMHQLDVKTTFLYALLQEEVFMQQPEGFVDSNYPKQVCKLLWSLYGLKQSPQMWFQRFNSYLLEIGFLPCSADGNVYVKKQGTNFAMLGLYVDDSIVISNSSAFFTSIKHDLFLHFEMVDNGELEYCLGIQITHDRVAKTITLSQPKYINDILARFNMTDCKRVDTPLQANFRLRKAMCPETIHEIDQMKDIPYSSAIGSMLDVAASTCPDISYEVGRLAQFMANPGLAHVILGGYQ